MPRFTQTDIELLRDRCDVQGLVQALSRGDYGVRLEAAYALIDIGPETVGELISALQNGDVRTRRAVAWAVQWRLTRAFYEKDVAAPPRDTRLVASLMAAAQEKDKELRLAAVAALGFFGDPQVFEILRRALEDKWKEVRYAAARSLGELGDERALWVLQAALGTKDWNMRAEIVEALGKLKPAALWVLSTGLADTDRGVRLSAAQVLGDCGDPLAVAPLLMAFHDRDAALRDTARESLVNLVGDVDESWLPDDWITVLEDTIRHAAGKTLRRLKERAFGMSVSRVKRRRPRVR